MHSPSKKLEYFCVTSNQPICSERVPNCLKNHHKLEKFEHLYQRMSKKLTNIVEYLQIYQTQYFRKNKKLQERICMEIHFSIKHLIKSEEMYDHHKEWIDDAVRYFVRKSCLVAGLFSGKEIKTLSGLIDMIVASKAVESVQIMMREPFCTYATALTRVVKGVSGSRDINAGEIARRIVKLLEDCRTGQQYYDKGKLGRIFC